ncbi:MAG: hypothetical protein A2Z17_07185 [Gammaproteobacteria bacterium RBG_16_66_13]|nr:MAG: hypothetical protein A2Z17_07185 [Gammaproteobacteria bacterium RBG_16_66_13]
MIDRTQFSTGAAAGASGAATATGYSPHIIGKILAVHADYQDSPPATTDFTLSDENDPAAENIVNLVDQATDIKVYPRRLLEDNTGADLTYDGTRKVHGEYVVHGRLKAVIAQANAADSVLVTVWFECY